MADKLIQGIIARYKLDGKSDVRIANVVPTIKSDAGNEYRFTSRITTDSLDRQGEVLIPDGMDASEFQKTGGVFWNHDYDRPVALPQGKMTRGANYVEWSAEFMKRPEGYEGEFFPDFARAFVTQAVAAGIFPGVSVGFISTRGRRATAEDKKKYGDGVEYVHSNWKLLEFSIAPVQANQDAFVVAIGKGLMKRDVIERMGISLPTYSPPAPPPVPAKAVTPKLYVYFVPGDKPAPKADLKAMIGEMVKDELLRSRWKFYA